MDMGPIGKQPPLPVCGGGIYTKSIHSIDAIMEVWAVCYRNAWGKEINSLWLAEKRKLSQSCNTYTEIEEFVRYRNEIKCHNNKEQLQLIRNSSNES